MFAVLLDFCGFWGLLFSWFSYQTKANFATIVTPGRSKEMKATFFLFWVLVFFVKDTAEQVVSWGYIEFDSIFFFLSLSLDSSLLSGFWVR